MPGGVLLETAGVDDCAGLAEQSDEFLTDEIQGYFDDVDIDIEIDDVSEDGDEATVDYSVKTEYTGDDVDGFKEAFSTDVTEEQP